MDVDKRRLLANIPEEDEDINDNFYTPLTSSSRTREYANISAGLPNLALNLNDDDGEDDYVFERVASESRSHFTSTSEVDYVGEQLLDDSRPSSSSDEDLEELPDVPYYKLFRFATRMDKFQIFIGCLLSILTGFCAPITNYAFGMFAKAMVDKGSNMTVCPPPPGHHTFSSDFMKTVETFVLYNCACGLLQFFLGYLMVVSFNLVAEHQAHKLKLKYFERLLRQEIGWFDTNRKKDFASCITDDIAKIQEAMSEKLGLCIFTASNFVLLVSQSYFYGWKLSAMLTFALPFILLSNYFQSKCSKSLTKKEQDAYSSVASHTQEVVTNIRTVVTFNGQQKEIQLFEDQLKRAKKLSYWKGALLGLGHGMGWFFCFSNYALAFWYGTLLVVRSREKGDDLYGVDTIVVIFFGMLVASYNISSAAEYFETFGIGTGSARKVFSVLDRNSQIDAFADNGFTPEGPAKGNIEFVDVRFSYPSRPGVPVLNGFNLNIRSGQSIALVGGSGAGKSTVVQLLQRFYDISSGEIKIDGADICDLNLTWLRSQFGLVSQEPILFNMTIFENIRLGKEGATQEEVEKAAQTAFAHNFIMKLPEGYNTMAGERGTQLSGGQKQRIAIARALIRNPPILLLDEATSALDMQSEAIVQSALDRARFGRTTIVLAHRLSTIKAADIVVVLENGVVAEIGTHYQLIEKQGVYFKLVIDQSNEVCPEEIPPSQMDILFGEDANSSIFNVVTQSPPPIIDIEVKETQEALNRKLLTNHFKLGRMLKMGVKEWPYLLASALCTMIKGCNVPIYSIVFGNYIAIFASYDGILVVEHGNHYALLYLIIAIATGLSAFFQRYFAVLSSDKFTQRMRRLMFRTVVQQDVAFFDEQENTVGKLCARLSSDASSMQGAIGNRLIGLVQAFTIVSLSLAMAFYYLPKMGAVICLFVPLAISITMIEGKILHGSDITEKKAIENAVNIAVEALDNIRTVQSLGVQNKFIDLYRESLEESHRINIQRAHIRAFAYGFVYALPYVAYALSLFYGAYLVEQECVSISDVFKVAEALIFGSMASGMLGTALAYAPDYVKGKIAAARIFKLLDRQVTIDTSPSHGKILKYPKGKVEFDKVHFSYPERPDIKALNNVSILIHPGDQIGLVGQTGSGKSSFVQLLLHFYDPQTGKIAFDSEDLRNLNTKDLRSNMAVVAQEPILFDRSIADNIAYGYNSRECSMNEIIEAARMANIHDFIVSLPAGYDTRVGSLGSQLSGGQKQRVSIARALIGNPKVLVLDEATSALDGNSEKLVQEALEKAQDGRSSITISHRLTSIQNSSHIFVMKDGRIVEHGTHEQLLSNCNQYYAMWYAQYKHAYSYDPEFAT